MITTRLLFVLFLIIQCYAVEDKCQELIDHWLNHPEELPPITYADSGKFLNDLGDYNNCLYHSNSYTYITMKLINKLVGFQYMGLCSPNECV